MDLTLKTGESDSESCSVMSDSLLPHGLYGPWNSPGQNTRVGNFSRGSSQPRSPALQVDSYHLSHQGSPRILEWVANPFSTGSSWSRNQIGVSCIAGGFFTSWARCYAWKMKSSWLDLGLPKATCINIGLPLGIHSTRYIDFHCIQVVHFYVFPKDSSFLRADVIFFYCELNILAIMSSRLCSEIRTCHVSVLWFVHN